ncbi:hypothetical protein JCM6882_002581 [Rhodosporidiobolus microsporus]
MALTQARLPAPLRLKPASIRPLSAADARTFIASFLDVASSHDLLAGSGVVRASLMRLLQGLEDAPAPAAVASKADDAADKKKRRKSEGGDGEGKKKKRKVAA